MLNSCRLITFPRMIHEKPHGIKHWSTCAAITDIIRNNMLLWLFHHCCYRNRDKTYNTSSIYSWCSCLTHLCQTNPGVCHQNYSNIPIFLPVYQLLSVMLSCSVPIFGFLFSPTFCPSDCRSLSLSLALCLFVWTLSCFFIYLLNWKLVYRRERS